LKFHNFSILSIPRGDPVNVMCKTHYPSWQLSCWQSVGTHLKNYPFINSTSNSLLNQFLMKYSVSLHYKRQHEQSMRNMSKVWEPSPLHPWGVSRPGWQWQPSGWQSSNWL